MRKVYLIPEATEVRGILNGTYNELLTALKVKNPKATELIDDEVYCQLHDALCLISSPHSIIEVE